MRGDYRFHNVLFGTVHKASGDHDQNFRKDEIGAVLSLHTIKEH